MRWYHKWKDAFLRWRVHMQEWNQKVYRLLWNIDDILCSCFIWWFCCDSGKSVPICIHKKDQKETYKNGTIEHIDYRISEIGKVSKKEMQRSGTCDNRWWKIYAWYGGDIGFAGDDCTAAQHYNEKSYITTFIIWDDEYHLLFHKGGKLDDFFLSGICI